MLFAANCGNIIRRYCFAAEYALVAQPVEHLTFNQRARDSSSLERTKIPRRIVRFLVGFSFFWGSAHFCTLFAHRRESRVFPCIVCILCIVSGTCRGKAPPSCWCKTAPSLKSPTGAFIAALRSQTRTCRGEAPPSCWRKTLPSLIAIQLLHATATALNCISQICCLNVSCLAIKKALLLNTLR